MKEYRFEIEYQGGAVVTKKISAANVSAAWFSISLKEGEFAKKIELMHSIEKED